MTDVPPPNTQSTTALLRRLFAEHGRQHVPTYAASIVLMAIGAAATAICAIEAA